MCRWLLLIARLDAADGCHRLGFHSTAAWLAYACGLSKRTANDHVRAAQALAEFEALAESMSAGRVSYSHVRAISRIARAGEVGLVDSLLNVAEHGTVAHLEVIIRGLHTVDLNETRDSDWVPDDYVRHGWTKDARWRVSARMDPEQGALVESAVAAVAAAEGISEVEALVRIAELAMAHVNDQVAQPRRELRGDERAAVVIHLDAERLERLERIGSAEPSRPYAHLADGPGLPDRVVRRLVCAGRIRAAVRDGTGNVLDLGRSQRLVSDRQLRALLIRDRGHCAHPGCANTRNLHAHHVVHWLDGGPTDMDNLLLLCQPHHLALHNGEYSIRATSPGQFRFTRADGTDLPVHLDPAEYITSDIRVETEHPDVDPNAARTNWGGERLQRDFAISLIAHNRKSAA